MKDIGPEPPLETGIYQHYKGGIYQVIGLACHSESREWFVVYESPERKKQNLPSRWIRPYAMFIENVTVDGKEVPRFRKID